MQNFMIAKQRTIFLRLFLQLCYYLLRDLSKYNALANSIVGTNYMGDSREKSSSRKKVRIENEAKFKKQSSKKDI